MHPPKAIFDAFLEWAIRSFRGDIETGFARAKTIDGYLSRLLLGSLQEFRGDRLKACARILPTSIWMTHPARKDLIGELSVEDIRVLGEFKAVTDARRKEDWQAFSNILVQKRRREVQVAAKRVRQVGVEAAKQFARGNGYELDQVEPGILQLSKVEPWGCISVDLDFRPPLV